MHPHRENERVSWSRSKRFVSQNQKIADDNRTLILLPLAPDQSRSRLGGIIEKDVFLSSIECLDCACAIAGAVGGLGLAAEETTLLMGASGDRAVVCSSLTDIADAETEGSRINVTVTKNE